MATEKDINWKKECHWSLSNAFYTLYRDDKLGIQKEAKVRKLADGSVASRYNTRKIADEERFELSVKSCDGRLKYKDLIAQCLHYVNNPLFEITADDVNFGW